MIVAASRVKSLCTGSEVALVRASRKGQLEQLSPTQLKRHAARARKLFDKWNDLDRGQSRLRSRQVGFGDSDANTRLKAQIFRESLNSFEAQLAKLESLAIVSANHAKVKTKKARTSDDRATRAAIRKGMSAVEDLLNRPVKKKKK
jgi:hypothetical protein